MTKQIDILSTQTSDTKNLKSVSTPANKEVKQESSLFDKLLFGNVSSSDDKDETSTEKIKVDSNIPTNNKNMDVNINSQDKIEKNTVVEEDNKNSSTPIKSTSLLDRLVLEAKKSTDNADSSKNIKDTQSTTNILKSSTKIETSSENEESKLEPKSNELKTSDIKNIDIDTSKNVVSETLETNEDLESSLVNKKVESTE